MTENPISLRDPWAGSTVTVPEHVVFRAFPNETVVLNLHTGKYHGLNPTAGAMLEALVETGSVADAGAAVAADYELGQEAVEEDLRNLCDALLERDLIEVKHEDA